MALKIALIAIGGGTGAVLRYLVGGWGQKLVTTTFPLGTLVVNVSGCLLIGAAAARFAGPHLVREELRVALLVGLLGGYTTFSTFGLETFALVSAGQLRGALCNLAVTNGLGLAAVWLGYRVCERWFGV